MKNRRFKHTIGLCATMLACASITIGSPVPANPAPGNPGNVYTDEDPDKGDRTGDFPEISPQSDDDPLTKINK